VIFCVAVQVHIFGNLNDHPMRTSDGQEINGPNVFGYNVDLPRFPSPAAPAGSAQVSARLPIRAVRYVGKNADGSICRFGARHSVVNAVDEQQSDSSSAALISDSASSSSDDFGKKRVASSALEVDEPAPPKPAPLWSQILTLIILIAALCGVIITMALYFSAMTKSYAEIYAVAVAGVLDCLCP
jgi:hypothetical protein